MPISDKFTALVNQSRCSPHSMAPEMAYLAEHPRKISADEYAHEPTLSHDPDLCYSLSHISSPSTNDSDFAEIMAQMAA